MYIHAQHSFLKKTVAKCVNLSGRPQYVQVHKLDLLFAGNDVRLRYISFSQSQQGNKLSRKHVLVNCKLQKFETFTNE